MIALHACLISMAALTRPTCCLLLTAAAVAAAAGASDVYVSPGGSDADGDGSQAQPFATLRRAQLAADKDEAAVIDYALPRLLANDSLDLKRVLKNVWLKAWVHSEGVKTVGSHMELLAAVWKTAQGPSGGGGGPAAVPIRH